ARHARRDRLPPVRQARQGDRAGAVRGPRPRGRGRRDGSRAVNRVAKWWFAALPAERIAGLRILIGAFATYYLWSRFHYLIGANHQPRANWQPIGVVGHILDRPLTPSTWTAIVIATQIAGWAFLLGILYRFTAPVFAVL